MTVDHADGSAPVATVDLTADATPAEACQHVADLLASRGAVAVTAFLGVHEGLRSFGTSGGWRMYYAAPGDSGALGHCYTTGEVTTEPAEEADESGYPLTPPSRLALCLPVPGERTTIGVVRVEVADAERADALRPEAVATADRLGERLVELAYAPRETMAERLVRHALSIVASSNESLLVSETLRAARDISGLATAVSVVPDARPSRCTVHTEAGEDGGLSRRVASLPAQTLMEIGQYTHRHGAWFTVGDPDEAVAPAPRALLDVGVRTVVAVPVGSGRESTAQSGVSCRTLLVMDTRVRRVNALTVGLLELLAAQSFISMERLRLLGSLRAQAKRDPLTGLGHQATFSERMTHAKPGRTALLLMDVDHFKNINDTRGHAAGDKLLIEVAAAAKGVIRAEDELYRIGGDEFVAVAEVNRAAEARGIAKRVIEAIRRVGCTVSIGVAIQATGESADDALHRADEAMYEAKRAGRDRIQLAVVPGPPAARATSAG